MSFIMGLTFWGKGEKGREPLSVLSQHAPGGLGEAVRGDDVGSTAEICW